MCLELLLQDGLHKIVRMKGTVELTAKSGSSFLWVEAHVEPNEKGIHWQEHQSLSCFNPRRIYHVGLYVKYHQEVKRTSSIASFMK